MLFCVYLTWLYIPIDMHDLNQYLKIQLHNLTDQVSLTYKVEERCPITFFNLKLGSLHTSKVRRFSCTRIVSVHCKDSHSGESNLLQLCLQPVFLTSSCSTCERWYYCSFGGGKVGSSKSIVSSISCLGGS